MINYKDPANQQSRLYVRYNRWDARLTKLTST